MNFHKQEHADDQTLANEVVIVYLVSYSVKGMKDARSIKLFGDAFSIFRLTERSCGLVSRRGEVFRGRDQETGIEVAES